MEPHSEPVEEQVADLQVWRIRLRGEELPRACRWDPTDLTMAADLDQAVEGRFDPQLLWHLVALFWVASGARDDMDLREFGRRFPWGGEDARAKFRRGAAALWHQITS